MIKKKSSTIIDYMIEKMISSGSIKKEDADIYIYGLDSLLTLSICTVVMFCTSFVMKKFEYTSYFFLTYTILRAFIGGLHLLRKDMCIIFSSAIYLISIWISNTIKNLMILNLIAVLLYTSIVMVKVYLIHKNIGNKSMYRNFVEILIGPFFLFFLQAILRMGVKEGSMGIVNAMIFCGILYWLKVFNLLIGERRNKFENLLYK